MPSLVLPPETVARVLGDEFREASESPCLLDSHRSLLHVGDPLKVTLATVTGCQTYFQWTSSILAGIHPLSTGNVDFRPVHKMKKS